MKPRFLLWLLALLPGLIAGPAFAQSSFGTILGTVVDQSNAVVAHAPVQITNTATGVVSTVTTTGSGDYTAVNLVPGPYLVSVELQGFQKTETSAVLVANQLLRLDLKLRPGKVSETVEISASGALLDTDTPAITTYVGSREIADLPLSSRNFMQLLVLSPATLAAGQAFGGGGFAAGDQSAYRSSLSGGELFVGGASGSSNQYLIDGVDNNDPGFQTPTITPSIDAIGGIRLMNKNYPAEFGGSAAQINIATKSGTNQYHGTLYEFFRNDALDATDFFAKRDPSTGRIKPVLRYNQFGGSLGGPITIPKVINGHDRLFFFFNYEGTRSHSLTSGFARFPTPAELSGDFSADPTIYNPATGLPFPDNKIPSIDPKAAQIIALGVFPTPNVTPQPGYNTVKTLLLPNDIDQWMARVDARISSRDSLFVRFSNSSQDRQVPAIDPFGNQTFSQAGKNLAVSYTHIFSPSIVNEFRAGLNRPISLQSTAGAFGTDISGSLFTGTDPAPATYGLTYMTFAQYATIGGAPNAPLDYTTTDSTISDNLTFMRGAHTLKFGGVLRKLFFKEINASTPRGNIGFSGIFTSGPLNSTGNSIADFLLGYAQNAGVNQGNYTGWYNSHGWDLFAQDDWKVTPNLTVDIGLRYEYLAPFQEEHDRVSSFDPTYPGGRFVTPNVAAANEVNSPLIGTIKSRNIVEPDRNNIAPRVGFSYRPLPKTVVRSGYGVFFDTLEFNEYIFPVLNPPFQKSVAENAVYPGSPVIIDNLFPIASTPAPVAGGMVVLALDPHSRTSYVQNWNLDLERELGSSAMVEIGYLGSQASKVHNRRWGSQGILGTPGDPSSITFPYYNFAAIIETTTGSSSNYHAGFVRFTKRFSHGYSLLANYTYSKTMGTSSGVGPLGTSAGYPQNSWDLDADYGALSYDATHNFVLSGIWNLPFGRNQLLANNLPTALNLLVDGWQLNGIFSARSGFPFQVNAVDFSGTVTPNPRADVVSDPHAPDAADPSRAFNRYAFAQPGLYTFGNSSTDVLRGRGLTNTDLSLFKNTNIRDRVNAQFRLEAFNAFNQAQIGPFPGTFFSLDPGSSFGTYDSLQHEARIVQLAFKLIF